MSEEETKEVKEATKEEPKEEKKRRVVMSTDVKVIFERQDGPVEVRIAGRDVFSVMDAITARLAETKSKEEMEGIRVSVHSYENPDKSDPPKEGEERWEGPYLVAGIDVEKKPIPEAMEEIAKVVLPADHAMLAFEQVAAQCFTRSRMDAAMIVCTFDGVPAVTPLFNTMKAADKKNVVSFYRTVLKAAEAFRRAALDKFKDIGIEDKDFDEDPVVRPEADAEERARKLVLPSGLPASMSQKGVVTPQEARKDQVRVIGLT